MNIVLIGYMGSGKSAVGSSLAKILGVKFLDLDAEIEKEVGMTIPNIFDKKCEIYFRKKEKAILFDLLKQHNKSVIATGGGTPCYGTIMQELAEKTNVSTIYLKASLDTLTKRLAPEKENRPLIAHLETEVELNDFIRKHLFERNFYYFQSENSVVVDNKTIQTIVEEIIADLF